MHYNIIFIVLLPIQKQLKKIIGGDLKLLLVLWILMKFQNISINFNILFNYSIDVFTLFYAIDSKALLT